MRHAHRRTAAAAALLGAAALLAACSSSPTEPDETTGAEGALAEVCPETVVIQTDWEPESEHGGVYRLLGDDYEPNVDAKSVSGPLMDGDEPTGVDVEIRIGGSPVGFQSAQSLLYQDPDILFGFGRVSEYMTSAADTPVTAVLATLETSPYSIYWDPETYPDVETIADLGETGATVFVGSQTDVWIDYLVGSGQLEADQIDRSDAPKPATFVAAGGEAAEAGFITSEPFMYEHEIAAWGRPVMAQLIADAGYPEYFQALVVRASDVTEQAACLEELVPVLQRAQVAYAADPAPTSDLIVDLVDAYDTGWVYTPAQAEYAADEMLARGIIANGPDGTVGSFSVDRVAELVSIVDEYTDYDLADVEPEELVTNQFLDPAIALD